MDTTDLLKIAELDFNEFENIIAENPNLITAKDANDRLLLHWLDSMKFLSSNFTNNKIILGVL